MRIVVCVRPDRRGEISQFEAAAYECALRVPNAEVLLLSMAPPKGGEVLAHLSRLGAAEVYHLCDPAFAGADTLATTYALALALARLSPDLVFCGRQTMEGDTGQVGPGLAARLGLSLASGVMQPPVIGERDLLCVTRAEGEKRIPFPALLTFERILALRLPSLFSKPRPVTVWRAADIGADASKCGQAGSPTRVIASEQNQNDRRRCAFLPLSELEALLKTALAKEPPRPLAEHTEKTTEKLLCVGEAPVEMTRTVGENIVVIPPMPAAALADRIRAEDPLAVLFDSTPAARELAATVAVLLGTGLCADCTALSLKSAEEAPENQKKPPNAVRFSAFAPVTSSDAPLASARHTSPRLVLTRPAFAGDLLAHIECRTRPAMATLRTGGDTSGQPVFGLGMGALPYLEQLRALAAKHGAELAASRALVESGALPYAAQVGLTGKSIAPRVYVAFGISGAVHHIAGIKSAGTIIAVNCDKSAPIFGFADYGIVADLKDVL